MKSPSFAEHQQSSTELAKSAEIDAPFLWRRLEPEEAILAYQLHLEANADAPQGLVRPDPLSHFTTNIEDKGLIVACFIQSKEENNKMVAYGILGLQSETNINLAHLLGLSEQDIPYFATLDGVATLAPWRGNRLHRESIQARLTQAKLRQRRFVAATVSPDNINSMRGLLEAGFCIKKFAYLYGGLARLVMLIDLQIPPLTPSDWTLGKAINANEHAGHQNAIAKGWTGYALAGTASGVWQVHYGTPKII